jgi:hypothetical protein
MATPEEEAAAAKAESERKAAEAETARKAAEAEEERKKLADPEHAAKVIKNANADAKKQRERAEAAEAEREAIRKERDDAAKWRTDRENKDLEEQGKLKELAEREKARADDAEKKAAEREKQHVQDTMRERLRAQAVRRGIIDDELVDHFDLTGLKLEDGKLVGGKELLDKIAESKPLYFKKPDDVDDKNAPLDRPRVGSDGKPVDAAKLSDQEFAALRTRMRSARA